MHLRFTEEELAILIEMVSLAAEVANHNQAEGAPDGIARFESIEHKVLESARHHGLGEVVEYDEVRKKNRVTEAFQKESFFQQCYEEFRNASFWEGLMARLAERDVVQRLGQKKWKTMNEESQRKAVEPSEQRYWKKFVAEGVERLHWIEGPEAG